MKKVFISISSASARLKAVVLAAFLLTAVTSCKGDKVISELEARCNDLSVTNGLQYQTLSGHVFLAEKMMWPGFCTERDCHLDKPSHFAAYLETASNERLQIITATETFAALQPKPKYMEEGNTYAFCAREIKLSGNPGHNYKVYQVDSIDTIKLIAE